MSKQCIRCGEYFSPTANEDVHLDDQDCIIYLRSNSLVRSFQRRVGKWSDDTFPESETATRVAHMKKELNELVEATDINEIAEECADVYLMLLHEADAHGFDLLGVAKQKFEIVKLREWNDPDENGIIEHNRSKQELPFKIEERYQYGR